ncbi:hypothetical protein SFRURICE_020532 [Spodoptera frugiperda]|nr:hypothetical protein SFRURICE_020532 [Spodoptera frugiperda]
MSGSYEKAGVYQRHEYSGARKSSKRVKSAFSWIHVDDKIVNLTVSGISGIIEKDEERQHGGDNVLLSSM